MALNPVRGTERAASGDGGATRSGHVPRYLVGALSGSLAVILAAVAASASLQGRLDQAQSALASILASLNDVSDKFFIKTMMSVPPTKACRTEAAAVAALVADQKWSSLPAAVEKLDKAAKALVTKAKMDGTTIT